MPRPLVSIGRKIGSVGQTARRWFDGQAAPAHPIHQHQRPDVVEASKQVLSDTTGRFESLSQMTPEALKQRRLAIIANISFDVPPYRKVLNLAKNIWRIIGPFAFVVFTAWEVFYFINHFMQADNALTTRVLLWGITLLIEVPFMIATYDLSERKASTAEKRANGIVSRERDTWGAIAMWLFLALVNVCGQVAFLVLVTKVGDGNAFDGSSAHNGLLFFIAVRVLGVIAGDAYTAFFLKPDETTVERVLRAQDAQSAGLKRLGESDADRLKQEADTDQYVRHIQTQIAREEREASFMRDWQQAHGFLYCQWT